MINADTYSEVYEILSYMNKSIVMKVPVEILEVIKENRNLDYVSKIDKEDLFNLNNISKDTINVLAWLDVNYWIDKEKKEKIKISYGNEFKESNHGEIYIFEKVEKESDKIITDEVQVKIYKETIINRIINKIKNLINIK